MPLKSLPKDYPHFLNDLKTRIRAVQVKALLSVNQEMIALYWQIGGDILERQRHEGWGMATVRQLSRDLAREFPSMTGFSPKNIWRMRAFYLAWNGDPPKVAQAVRLFENIQVKHEESAILPQPVSELPWGHNIVLFQKLKNREERLWYAQHAFEHGWSRNVLIHQIESGLHRRQGKAQTNFARTLPEPQSELAQQALKDGYALDFIATTESREKAIERGLIAEIQYFLLELGKGFAFVGRQYRLEVGGEDFYIDLLFYNLILRCYVVIELKAGEFRPEHAGKLSFYLSAVDDLLRHPDDRPSIGMVLCKSKNQVVAEYALRDIAKPIGVASYHLTKALPDALAGRLPTTEELEDQLRGKD